MSESDEIQAPSLYDRLGGEAAITAAVGVFYDKVLNDYRINRFFEKTDMTNQIEHLNAFMTVAFGGPNNYTGRSLRDGHARLVKLGLNGSHFDAVAEHLGVTMQELGVPSELIAEAGALVESVRGEVLAG